MAEITLTIQVTPERAAFIAALIHMWHHLDEDLIMGLPDQTVLTIDRLLLDIAFSVHEIWHDGQHGGFDEDFPRQHEQLILEHISALRKFY